MIYVVIPVHNRSKSTLRCLEGIYKQDVDDILRVVVVNDGSSDSTRSDIEREFSSVLVLEGDGSLFWTGGVKLGVEYVLGASSSNEDWIILMNNDVELPDSQVFRGLIEFSSQYQPPALVAPLSVSSVDHRTVVTSGTKMKSWFLNLTQHVFNGTFYDELNRGDPEAVDFMTARCLLHPIKVFREIGNYDAKHFPHYGGDDEFSYRAKKNGYDLFVLPSLVVYLNENEYLKENNNRWSAVCGCLFGVRSSINLRDKFVFAFRVPPLYARFSYFFFAVLKTFVGCCRGN